MRTYVQHYPNTVSVYSVQTSNGRLITPSGVYQYVPNQPVQNLTMGSFICPQQTMVIPQVVSPGMFYAPMQPVVGGTPVYQTTQLPPAPVQQAPAYTESDVQQMKDMFPGIETNVIQSVFIAQRGNKNAVINSLLSMSSEQ